MPDETILVVEDDDDIRDLLATLLTWGGYVVHTAENGRDALDRLRTVEPSAILLDVMMPVMGGVEFLRHFKQRRPDASTPIVVLTAAGLDAARRAELAAYTVINKPVGVQTLLATLRDALDATPGSSAS